MSVTNTKKVTQAQARDYAKDAVSTVDKRKELRDRLFPTWNPHTAKIYETITEKGMAHSSVSLSDLMCLYPGAMKMGEQGDEVDYGGPQGKALFISHIKEWLAENTTTKDLVTFSRYFAKEVSKKIDQTKGELRNEFGQPIKDLQQTVIKQAERIKVLEEITKKSPIFDRELIVVAPVPEWDVSGPQDALKLQIVKYLEPYYTERKLVTQAIQSVREIEDTKQGDKRYSIIMATIEQKEEIAFRASGNDDARKHIKGGVPPHIRAQKVLLHPYRMASSKYNYESQQKGHPVFSRVEIDKSTEKPKVQKYHKSQAQVSNTALKAAKMELTDPAGYIEKEHAHLIPDYEPDLSMFALS